MTPSLKFADLNPLGRAIIIVIATLTAGVAAVAFATSYGALYAFIRDTHLYSDRLTRIWPLCLDAAFIVAQLAAILGGILRGRRGWPILTMLLTGALTVWFNVIHAGDGWGRQIAAALPPILMMLCFEIDISITKWVMRALGKPLETTTPLPAGMPLIAPAIAPAPPPAGMLGGSPYGPYFGAYGMVPPAFGTPPGTVPQAVPPGLLPYPQTPSPTSSANGQTGQPGWAGSNAGGDAGEAAADGISDGVGTGDAVKRQWIEGHLARCSAEQLARLTGVEIAAALERDGKEVSARYARTVLDQWNAARQQQGSATGARKPRKP